MTFPTGLFAVCDRSEIIRTAEAHGLWLEDDGTGYSFLEPLVPGPCVTIGGANDTNDVDVLKQRLCAAINDLVARFGRAGIVDDMVGLGDRENEARFVDAGLPATPDQLDDYDMNSMIIRRYRMR